MCVCSFVRVYSMLCVSERMGRNEFYFVCLFSSDGIL